VGAQRRTVLWMVLRESVVLTVAGFALGLPLALEAVHSIRSFLFGVPIVDPLAIGGAALLIAVASLAAGSLPAFRAAKMDPMRALRHE
jgi:ABC-type antimicrobial peptide transport system permease subunit